MHLVQILLPVRDNQGVAFPRSHFDRVRDELAERFGGVTAFLRSPAEGVWKDHEEPLRPQAVHDDVVIYEVMTDHLDRSWWQGYRESLATRFAQDEVVVRATACERL